MKKVLFSAVFTAFAFCAMAQTQTPTVTAKCPCDEKLEHWEYKKWTKLGMESLYSEDAQTITLDWKKQEVVVNGDVFKMDKFEVSAVEPMVTVNFYGLELVIKYNKRDQYRGHTLKEKF